MYKNIYSDFNILKSCMHAIKHNVPKVHLINRHVTGSIIAELFTEKGSGTIFTDHPREIIRQAESKDLKKIYQLNAYSVLLTRARQGMVIFIPKGNPTDPTLPLAFYYPV